MPADVLIGVSAVGDMRHDSSLIPLGTGYIEPPVFLVPGLGNTIAEFECLMRHFRSRHRVYAVLAHGLNAGETPHDRVDAMAEHCVDAIRSVQPHGPYLLVGNSFGGLVALETARRLSALNEKVALLAMLDTYPSSRYWPLGAWLSMLRRRLHHHVLVIRGLRWRQLPAYVGGRWPNLVRHLLSRRGSPRQVAQSDDDRVPPALLHVRAVCSVALANYRPKFYPGKIVYFKPEIATEFPDDIRTVWGSLATEIEVHIMPGDHVGMSTVHADGLAGELARCIEDAIA